MDDSRRRQFYILAAGLLLAVLWNYWLPTAEDFFNLVSEPSPERLFPMRNVDFFAYHNGGSRFIHGENPYYFEQSGSKTFSDFIYPPAFLPVFGLISRLEYDLARTLWALGYGLAHLAALGMLTWACSPRLRGPVLVFGSALTLLSFPLLMHIHNGQADVWVSSLTVGGLAMYARGHRSTAAALVAAAALLKVSPLLLLAFFVLYLRDWRFLRDFTLAGAGMAALSLVWVPVDLYWDYAVNILPAVGAGSDYWLNQSLIRFFAQTPWLAQSVSLGGLGAFGLYAWLAGRRAEPLPGRQSMDVRFRTPLTADHLPVMGMFLLNLLVILLFSGRAWSMMYAWTILPTALVLAAALNRPVRPWHAAVLLAGVVLLLAKVYGYPVLSSLNMLGSLVLAGWLVWQMQRGQAPTPGG